MNAGNNLKKKSVILINKYFTLHIIASNLTFVIIQYNRSDAFRLKLAFPSNNFLRIYVQMLHEKSIIKSIAAIFSRKMKNNEYCFEITVPKKVISYNTIKLVNLWYIFIMVYICIYYFIYLQKKTFCNIS